MACQARQKAHSAEAYRPARRALLAVALCLLGGCASGGGMDELMAGAVTPDGQFPAVGVAPAEPATQPISQVQGAAMTREMEALAAQRQATAAANAANAGRAAELQRLGATREQEMLRRIEQQRR